MVEAGSNRSPRRAMHARSLAQEQLALLDLRQGNTEAAKAQLKKLSEDTTAPSGVRGRAGALLDRVGG